MPNSPPSNGILQIIKRQVQFVMRFETKANREYYNIADILQPDCGFSNHKSEFEAVQKIDTCLQIVRGMLNQHYITPAGAMVDYAEMAKNINDKIAQADAKYSRAVIEAKIDYGVLEKLKERIEAIPMRLSHDSQRRRITQLIKSLKTRFNEYEVLVGRAAVDCAQLPGKIDELDIEGIFNATETASGNV